MANQDRNPQGGVQGSSSIYNYGTSPNTRSAVSQKARVLAPTYGDTALSQVGVMSSFAPSESKTVEAVRGIGFGDMIAESVPGVTEPTTASVERTLLYLANLWQATGYASGVDGPVRSLRHQKWPFDIEEQLVFSTLADNDLGAANTGFNGATGSFNGGAKAVTYPQLTPDEKGNYGANAGHTALITMYEACWWTSHSKTYSAADAMVMESGDLQATDVHDFASNYGEFLATGNDPTLGQVGSIRYGGAGVPNQIITN